MKNLLFASCQSPISDYICRAVIDYLNERLGDAIAIVDNIPWQDRYAQIDTGQIQVGWI